MKKYQSWGRFPQVDHDVERLSWVEESILSHADGRKTLPFGQGRSYGDSCLNDGGYLIDTSHLDRFIRWDEERGIFRCEAGMTFAEILKHIVPKGWFFPVTPGTKTITVGGAIANDIHGKNHHREGTFGCHVRRFLLLRSNGARLICSSSENPDFFKATIGGLGLTGVILWAEFQLKRIVSSGMTVESIKFKNLDEYFELSQETDARFNYTVAWLDSLATGSSLGRGVLLLGNHDSEAKEVEKPVYQEPKLYVPFDAPKWLLSPLSIRFFNFFYYHKQIRKSVYLRMHFDPFFYPLDALKDWNRLYGKRGFLQYQCVVPQDEGSKTPRRILKWVTDSGLGSFLTVIKTFGGAPSPGMMSFPRKGVTLCFDFANSGGKLFELLNRLDGVVRECGGAVYPAKDARMSPESFRAFFPQWQKFADYVDPGFSSSFWRRVTEES